jgi:hypothetical protein
VALQIPAGYGLQKILDHKTWTRRKRALMGLAAVGIPLMAAWIWEIVRTRNYNRHEIPVHALDWSDDGFAPIFVLFMLNWVSSILMQYVILYYLSCMTNSPTKAANYAVSLPPCSAGAVFVLCSDRKRGQGVYRSFLAAGEAIIFGLDSIAIPYIKEAGVLFAFYTTGIIIFIYLAAFHITETQYFTGEEGVVIPTHVIREHEHELGDISDKGTEPAAEQNVVVQEEKSA